MIDDLSSRVGMIQAVCNGHVIGSATGFYIRRGLDVYLITNWHVLSGRRPSDNQPMDGRGAIPDKISISWLSEKLNGGGVIEIDLNDESGNRRWLEHSRGKEVDVAAIKIDSPVASSFQVLDIESLYSTDLLVQIGMQTVVVGYPFGIGTSLIGHPLPIWKTGHIASEPSFSYRDKEAVLVDVTGRSGMSGSPVFVRSSGPYRLASSNVIVMSSGGVATKFLGVYSGRITTQMGEDTESDSHLSSELGLVWSPSTIDDILRKE